MVSVTLLPPRRSLSGDERTRAVRLLVVCDGVGLPEGVVSDVDLLREVAR